MAAARRVRGVAARPLRAVGTLWRRSIQARVVLSTVVLSAVVVSLVGWTLLQQVTDGLVQERVKEAVAESGRATEDLQVSLSAATPDFEASAQLASLMSTEISRGAVRGYDVVLVGPLSVDADGRAYGGGQRFTPGLDLTSLPDDLTERVGAPQENSQLWTFTRLRYDGSDGRAARPDVPGVAVGTRLVLPADGDTYALYHLFPMSAEQRTIDLVERAILTSGVLLLILVAALTWLVTRQVVTPVRLARRTAERLSSGRLEQRMLVKGDDDIARLATSFNHMASSLQKQIRKLEDMSAAQRRFVSDVSHELRTPLTTVRMASDVLHDARDRFDPVTARSAELLQNELDRFETLLADLLEISRFDAGAAALEVEDVNLLDVAHRVVGSLAPLAAQRDVRIVVRPQGGPCVVEADTRRLERIVRNLVTNAIDYADSSDVVVLVAADAEGSALAVRDYGVGLRPGDEVRVFNRFWRADPSRVRRSGGTGLGLSISQEDARLHGGWLEAWGAPGAGSQFRLSLPRRAGGTLAASALPLVPADAGLVPARSGRVSTP
ncbi:HAMP domain-containing histidine kinase [Nocardioides sp. HDW12B]|uniref:MtrAB system histidine kinase MtrB n=1 Tax=Nocardioides sp. HDW12B TaxID=2714939 RepID=UPI00140A0941|nr:MtrAB system histidine kinase MtrB [Nocardioides sp. HDW12B]QIK65587.1 HAMP domain-containing histidine kinase [Nocardioides sp. HDW12B]